MDEVKGRALLVLMTISLIVSIFASSGAIGSVQASGPTYTSHSPIHINSNSDLAELRLSGGCTGNGTLNDPYVIKGYDITGSGGTCIYIGNTTKYLVISECRLHGNSAGIELIASSHVIVSRNICNGNADYGIHTVISNGNVIEFNVCTATGRHAMFLQDSNNNIIQNNSCTGSLHCSNWLSNSNNNVISNNTSSGSGGCGLQIQSSDHNVISNNTLSGNAQHGIRLFDTSSYNTVIRNICEDNSYTGISMSSATNNSIAYNIVNSNSQYGISQYSSSNNGIYGNELLNNNGALSVYNRSHIQAYTDGAGLWNSSSFGNFWSDWIAPDANKDGIVDNQYLIDGGTGAADRLPLTSCIGLHLEISGPSQALNGDDITWSFLVRNDGRTTLLNAMVIDPILNKAWNLGDVTPGGASQWSYPGAIPSYENITNIAYASGTDVYGGIYNVSASHTINVLRPSSPPQGLTVTAQDVATTLVWNAPYSNGGAPITDYRIFRGTSSGAESYIGNTSSGTVLTFTDPGLTNGQTYYYQVSAVNSAGEGSRCSESAATPIGPPAAPQDLHAIPGNGQVILGWSAPSSNGGANVDYYVVYQNGTDVLHVASTSATITGLTNGQTYGFTISAHNSANGGPQCPAVSAIPSPLPAVPGAPSGLTAMPGNDMVTINWLAPSSDGGAAIDYYLVYVDGVARSDYFITTSATITGLTGGHSYSFTVAGHNSAGMGAQSATVTTAPSSTSVPGVPTGLIVSPGNGQVSLTWTSQDDNGGTAIDYFIVYQNGVDVQHTSTTAVTINGLTNGQPYDFNVAAHNSIGTGMQTPGVSATPNPLTTVPGVPTSLDVTSGMAQIILNWIAPSNNGGATIDFYIVYQDGIDISHPTATSAIITSLTNGRSYNFTVAAHNSAGIGEQTSAIAATPNSIAAAPGIPIGLSTTAGNGTVTLSWTAPSGSSDIDYYIIYQNGVDVGHISSTSTTISGLTNGESYSFAVAAHNSGGVGTRSSVQNISPIAQNSDSATSPDNNNMVIILGVFALLAVIILGAFVALKKKRKGV
ncbi:MAG TPA: fibronectin type III domain-containing protein [Methanomassiliicoccales archaeon]